MPQTTTQIDRAIWHLERARKASLRGDRKTAEEKIKKAEATVRTALDLIM